jgi:hypothetical protein
MSIKNVLMIATMAATAALASTAALADDKPVDKTPGSGPNPWADCGIGASIFTETKWAAVTSNIIWDLGITAITSATSSPQTCSGKRVAAALFINDTYDRLAEETAVGQGEHLTTVLNIFECGGAHHAEATKQIRNAMGMAVSNPAYTDRTRTDKASGFYSIIETAVSNSCTG